MMRWGRIGAVLLGLAAGGMPAAATSYSDFNVGISLRGRDDDGAIRYLTSALADPALLPSFRAVALRIRADAYLHEGKEDLALADYTASLKLKPTYDVLMMRGELYVERDDLDAALSDFTAAETLRPDLLRAPYQRVRVFLLRDRYDDALTEETALLGVYTKYPPLYGMRAAAYRGKGDLDAAMREADYAVSLSKDYADGYDAKAYVYEEKGQLDDALSAVRDAVDARENDFSAVLHKGVILWELKRYGDAESAFADAQKIRPGDAYAAIWLFIAHRNRRNEDLPADQFKAVDPTVWPAPILAMLEGQTGVDATLALARTQTGSRRDQICDAEFYGGQHYLLVKDVASAEPLMALAAKDCTVDSVERVPARLRPWQ